MKKEKNIAALFGYYLDHDDFKSVKPLIADDCIYDIGHQLLKGKDEIVDSYESNMKEGREKLDELIWEKCRVEQLNNHEYEVYFSDFLKHQGLSHNYKCKQKLVTNSKNEIIRIEHIELPGEKEKLNTFYEFVGLKKK